MCELYASKMTCGPFTGFEHIYRTWRHDTTMWLIIISNQDKRCDHLYLHLPKATKVIYDQIFYILYLWKTSLFCSLELLPECADRLPKPFDIYPIYPPIHSFLNGSRTLMRLLLLMMIIVFVYFSFILWAACVCMHIPACVMQITWRHLICPYIKLLILDTTQRELKWHFLFGFCQTFSLSHTQFEKTNWGWITW